MKTKLALSLIALSLACACSGLPTYDESTFPAQVVYGASSAPPAASFAKDATGN